MGLLRRIIGPKREYQQNGKNYTIKSFIVCIFHQTSLGRPNQVERDGWDV
jgi:hypothetical protein